MTGLDETTGAIVFFLFGVVFGSFYNALMYRLPIRMPISKGRSICPNCKHTLGALDLVPILSWLFLRGKCRYCGKKISPAYLIIEFITGVLFTVAWLLKVELVSAAFLAAFWSMLLIVTIMDYRHMLIAESVLVAFTVICAACLLWQKADIVNHLLGGAVGFGVYFAIHLLAKLVYKKDAFGFGDVELMASIGLLLGLRGSVETLGLSFYVAVIGLIVMKLLGKAVKRGIEIPFGPYICIAGFLVSLFEENIYAFYSTVLLGRPF
ncbi:MAG: prepilin peptidase [Clostridiales bacterium]|jgi:leader peptidase (prepilin peptidase)/N-methyltransferase|nr:prepilin peptidase [Clostridiales bacterium]